MLDFVRHSNKALLPAPVPLRTLPQRINGYQVSSSSMENNHIVKRDKSRASITPTERTELWKRFQELNLTDYCYQNNPALLSNHDRYDRSLSTARDNILRKSILSRTGKSALKKSVSFADDTPKEKNTQGISSESVIYDVPKAIAIPSHFDIPRENAYLL